MLNGEQEFTKGGKRRRASYQLMSQWMSDSVAELEKALRPVARKVVKFY